MLTANKDATNNRREVISMAGAIAASSQDCCMMYAYWADSAVRERHRRLAIKRAYKRINPVADDPLMSLHRYIAQKLARRASPRHAIAERSRRYCDPELMQFARKEAQHLCRVREAFTGFAWQVDHMIPILATEATGLDVPANLQLLPARLNMMKSNRMIYTEPMEWMRNA